MERAVMERAVERFDVVVVGGRVSGAAAATRFARAGLSVLVLERGARDSDVPSTHTIQDVPGLVELVSAAGLRATRAPRLTGSTLWVDDLNLSTSHSDHPWVSVRRVVLDELLRRAAVEAGAQVRFGHRVTALHLERGRVAGVRYRRSEAGDSSEYLVLAGLVVGADGRSSAIARLAGARRYNVTWNERGAAWCYLRGVPAPTRFYFQRFDDQLLLAAPCEHGLVMLSVQPAVEQTAQFRPPGAIEEMFRQHGRPWQNDGPDWAERLAGAERDGDTRMMLRYQCFFREAAGPGWALLGDAGLTKDVVTGQGISDGLRQAERLVSHVLAGWPRPRGVDAATRRYWRFRDRDAAPMYWLSQDMGRSGPIRPLYRGFFEKVAGSPKLRGQLQDVLGQRRGVRRFTTVPRILTATTSYARRPGVDRPALREDVLTSARLELRRRVLGLRPEYQPERAVASAAPGSELAIDLTNPINPNNPTDPTEAGGTRPVPAKGDV